MPTKILFTAVFLVITAVLVGCQDIQETQGFTQKQSEGNPLLETIEQVRDSSIGREERKRLLLEIMEMAADEPRDSVKSQYYSRLSLTFLQLPDSSLFRETNRQAIYLAQKVRDTLSLADAYWDLADLFNSYSIPDSSFYNYSEAQNLYSQIGNEFQAARMLYNMAVMQAEVKDYTGSEINTIKAIELFKPLSKWPQLYLCYSNLGSITKELEEYGKAIEYYEQAGSYLENMQGEHTFRQSLYNNLGVVYQEMGRHEEALAYFRPVTATPRLEQKHPKLYARALINQAYSEHKLSLITNVTDEFKIAVKILDSIEDWQGVARGHYNGAEYYRDRRDTAHALAHANLAMEYALRSKNNKRLLETMELLVSLDPENAVGYTQAYIKLDDSLQREERAIRNKFARIRFETDEFIAQNQLLARQRQLWIGVAAGVFLLAFSVLIIILQRIKNQRLKFQQQQQESNQEIFNLMLAQNQKLEEGKQSEQKRISEELHDGILGEMNGVRMVLLGLNKKADEAAIALRSQAIGKLQEIQEEIRTISHALSDASYRKFHNFVISLEELLKTIGDTAGLQHELTYDEDIEWDALKGDVKINLYRIVQESLQNCVKHAQAENIAVNLHGNSKYIEVTISDDGRGFKPQEGKKGIGHKNISSRVKKLKGTWEMTSIPGKGTTVKVRVPYSEIGQQDVLGSRRKAKLQEA